MRRIALLTCSLFPDLVADDRLGLVSLQCIGIDAEPLVWDAPDVDLGRYEAIVLRSCWDYHLRAGQFLATLDVWAQRGWPVWNPVKLVRWNHDKRYLRDLEAQGSLVPPTVWVDPGQTSNLEEELRRQGWDRAVVKPLVSGGAYETWLTSPAEAPVQQPRYEALARNGGLMLQSFVPEIETAGEWSFLFFGGVFSHAVLKRAKQGDFRVQEIHGGTSRAAVPPVQLLEQARQVAQLIRGPWLYARVDGVEVDSRLVLMELELIEPFLFLATDPAAPGRFVDAVQRVLVQK